MATPDKIALVTGAGSGIGRAVALGLLEDKFSVIICGRRADALADTKALAGTKQANVLAVPTDLSNPEAIDALFTVVHTTFGRLDLLFNNAGSGAPPIPLEKLSLNQWQQVVDINLTAPFLCTQQAFRLMKQQNPQGGRIINNGSISAQVPRPNSAPYTATKHGITGLTKATSLDGRACNITCGQIDIGNALTDMTARMADGMPQADGSVKPEPTMPVSAVVDAVRYMAALPANANVPFLTVMANQMPYMGRG